jgi:GTPase SAR1 family protein
MFDLSEPKTLASVKSLHAGVVHANHEPVVVLLVGNKTDLERGKLTQEDDKTFEAEIKAMYREASALTGKAITDIFENTCELSLRLNPNGMRSAPDVNIMSAAPKEGRYC